MKNEIVQMAALLNSMLPEVERAEQGNQSAGHRVKIAWKEVSRRSWHQYHILLHRNERDKLVQKGKVQVYRLPAEDRPVTANLWVSDFAYPDHSTVYLHTQLVENLGILAEHYDADISVIKGYVPPEEWQNGGRTGLHTRGKAVRFRIEGEKNETVFQDVHQGNVLPGASIGFGIVLNQLHMDIRNDRRLWKKMNEYQRYVPM